MTEATRPPDRRERNLVLLLCLLAAAHVFIFSAAFPFFNNVDEQIHFDLAIKYSQGHVPQALEPVSNEAVNYIVLYSSSEYLGIPAPFPASPFAPPPWTQPLEKVRPALISKTATWRAVTNYEASQPPLYYSLAGLWWHLGKLLGFDGGHLLYWLRFLNMLEVVALVRLGHLAARLIFPENWFLRMGVPALIAFLPQTAFYSIQNDVLSPVCFGAAFIGLIKFMRTETPDLRLGIVTGLALAATFLTKSSNLPLLAVAGLVVLFTAAQRTRAGKLRAAFPSLAALALCAGLPAALWLAWCQHSFGEPTGAEAKIQFLGWTHKPFAEWGHHPIYTPLGFRAFFSDLLATFWQGELLWHRQPLALPAANFVYVFSTVVFLASALAGLLSKSQALAKSQRQALWFGFGCFTAAVAFFGVLSTVYDFHDCFRPSRDFPYFTSGRMMLGVLIPFLLLYLYGLDRALRPIRIRWLRPLVLAGLVTAMLAAEIATDWPVFPNQYNWFHM